MEKGFDNDSSLEPQSSPLPLLFRTFLPPPVEEGKKA